MQLALHLAELLVLRVVLAGMAGHAVLGHGVLLWLLVALEVVLVLQSSLWCHVSLGNGVVVRNAAGLARWHLRMVILG